MASDMAMRTMDEKLEEDSKHLDYVLESPADLLYKNEEEEPELHARTYIALAAMCLMNLVPVFALQGPSAVVCTHCNANDYMD